MNKIRRDYFTDHRVIIATERAKRPTDFIKEKPSAANKIKCPACGKTVSDEGNACQACAFCAGNEHLTPPGKTIYYSSTVGICQDADIDGKPRRSDWLVRVIPNLYPAVKPEDPESGQYEEMVASGVHEVIVESPEHGRQPQFMSDDEIKLLFQAYSDRFIEVSRLPFVRYVSIFRNHGKDAGASLSHPHSQLITLPVVPGMIRDQFDKDYTKIMVKEENSPRLVLTTEHTLAFAPYASSFPYEIWVFPRKPRKNISELTVEERDDFAIAMRDVLSRLYRLLSDPPYNYCFMQSVSEDMHMHIRICPKLGMLAGFELNTGMNINSVPPEDAARSLREI
ncbi:galactose-1-phosphate uridylyltransferase [Methanocella sp. CWC-04]|uniref:Galactose-1-phosphate uridylyltransferase n=1 Tax=Methanooceanicella nereidis TaxID=2052831 RepID=A0AAP2RCC2_9EURY|nr:DUF4921 family protein [Methanocella sp. CWC-04]MCD1294669.1 galactose-1-phosphate uridylyltransferase [Methanocella sp. CWC-04]